MTHNLIAELRDKHRRALANIQEWKFPAAELKPQLKGCRGSRLES